MDSKFAAHVKALKPLLVQLRTMKPVRYDTLPRPMPRAGVYLLSEHGYPLYVGRSNNIRRRLGRHCLPGSAHRMAALAFRLAREKTGKTTAAYARGHGTRAELMRDKYFAAAFNEAKTRIRAMGIRFVEEADPVRQALLEIYAAVVLATPYNDFDTH